MKWYETKDGDGYCRLSIEADWSELAADYEDIVDTYRKIPVAGFRTDRVPRHVVAKRFHRQIMDELSRRCGSRLGKEALREIGIEPLGPIEIGDIECGKETPFQFTVRFWPVPEIELPDMGSLIRDDSSDPRDPISHMLLEMVRFTIPDALVRAELGTDDNNTVTHESAEWKAAKDRVRLMVILKKIAGKEGIEVSESDVDRRIEEKAIEFGTDAAALREELSKGGSRPRLKDMLVAENTLDYLVEKATSLKGGQS